MRHVESELHTSLRLQGTLAFEVRSARTGRVLRRAVQRNLVVTAGKNLVRDLLKGDSTATITHVAVGTGTTAVVVTDTTLQTQVLREAATEKTAASAQLTVKYYLASGSANGNTLAEAGLFTAASGGTMYVRAILSSTIVKTSAVTVTFTWTLTF